MEKKNKVIYHNFGNRKKEKFSMKAYQELLNADEDRGQYLLGLDQMDDHQVFRLRLDLLGSEDLSDKAKEYAKVQKNISRTILVNGEMTLHALHYAIQRLFGWQNSHLHDYQMEERDFHTVTAGRFGTYAQLCGVLFRFPDYDEMDPFWDEDYEDDMDHKKWLRDKYTGLHTVYSLGDAYLVNQREVEELRERHLELKDEELLDDVWFRYGLMSNFNHMSEALTLNEVFLCGEQPDVLDWKSDIVFESKIVEEGVLPNVKEALFQMEKQLLKIRNSLFTWQKNMQYDPETVKRECEKLNITYTELLYEHRMRIRMLESMADSLFTEFNPSPLPYVNSIIYHYDYGDGWEVRITVEDTYDIAYEVNEDDREHYYMDSQGERVDDDLRQMLDQVHWKEKPVCVASDGIYVLDDCGGVGGFGRMLETIHGKDKEEAADMRAWAKGLGWTGRKVKLERML